MEPLVLSKFISESDIRNRVKEMGAQLSDIYKDKEVIAVCVLKGSFVFYSDLIRAMNTDVICDFIACSSYGNSMSSSGQVKVTLDLSSHVAGKHVVLVEDIIDSGLTMCYLQNMLKLRNPKSVSTVTLLHKPEAKKTDCNIDIVGFKIANDFVVGYGLDYQGMYRNLPYIAQVQNMN
ncbi:MAG: hypoxanthine phosphoribosyltransferase [Bdellovibrionaceae bacterium]|nr:hypoxanthine phosphoribosyltransferase [Pseudobdellovibrionaceae bacterium]